MHLSSFLIQFLSLLVIACAADTESYTVLAAAAAVHGVTLVSGTTYMFRELWPLRPGDNPDDPIHGISGARHVRLIVGQITGTVGNRDFRGEAFDLGVTRFDANGSPINQPTFVDRDTWHANQRQNNQNQWVRVGVNNNYEYVGVTDAALDVIEDRGNEYRRANPNYRLRNVNCRSYVNFLVGAFGKGPTWKRDYDEIPSRSIGARSARKENSALLAKRELSFDDRMGYC